MGLTNEDGPPVCPRSSTAVAGQFVDDVAHCPSCGEEIPVTTDTMGVSWFVEHSVKEEVDDGYDYSTSGLIEEGED